MTNRCLEVAYIDGRAFAAYYHFAQSRPAASRRSERFEPGLVVDFAEDDRPLGIEITGPGHVTLEQVNHVLAGLGLEPMTAKEFEPLSAA